jgi:hypothetical protein
VKGHRVDLLRVPAKVHDEEKGHAMALDQSALLDLLEALKHRRRRARPRRYRALSTKR